MYMRQRLATDGLGARRLVWLATVIGLTSRSIDVDRDTGVALLICAREAHRRRWCEAARPREVDLGARLLELRLVRLVGRVQGQDLNPKEVVAGSDT